LFNHELPKILFLDETNWFNYIKKGEELPQNGNNKQHQKTFGFFQLIFPLEKYNIEII